MMVQLQEISKIIQGGRHKKSGKHFVQTGGYPAYGAGGMNGYLVDFEFDHPGIVLSAIGARCGKCFLPSVGPWSSLANTQIIFPEPEKADIRFIWYQLNDESSWIRRGTGQPYIRPSDVKTREVYLPPLTEQRRVATTLDKADAIRRKRQQARELAGDLLRSAFLEMFGDPATNPHSFSIEAVAQHLSKERAGTQSGPFGSVLKKHEYVEEGVPVWGVDNVQHNEFIAKAKLFITEDKFEQLERYRVLPGDVLISRAGTVGRMCIAKPPVDRSIISTNLVRVVLDKGTMLPEYFVALFTYVPHRLGALKANNKDNAFTFLNPKTLKALEIPVPPIDLQRNFKHLSERMESHVAQLNEQLEGFDELFSSLAQRAFGGEL